MARIKVTIKSPDFGKWQKAVNDLRNKTGSKIVENAVENAPTDTGYYKSQISYDGSNTVTAHAKYSAAIEYGFDNYEETVNEHKSRRGSKTFMVKEYTRTVNRKPNPVMRNAAAKVQKEINQIWQEVQKENGL